MNETLFKEFSNYLQTVPRGRVKSNLLKTILLLIKYRKEEGLPPYMGEFLTDLNILFELLDAMDEEVNG